MNITDTLLAAWPGNLTADGAFTCPSCNQGVLMMDGNTAHCPAEGRSFDVGDLLGLLQRARDNGKSPPVQDQQDRTSTGKTKEAKVGAQETEEEKTNLVQLLSYHDLLGMEFTDRPVIQGLLGERESLVIVGQSGLGKSGLTSNLALRLATAGSETRLFDRFGIPQACRSLFIQSENTAAATQRRLARMICEEPELADGLTEVVLASIRGDIRLTGSLTNKKFKEGILGLIEQSRADILFLDPLISYHDADENDNGAMRRTLDCLTEVCDRAGIACVVVHHAGKVGTDNQVFAGRGASAIGDWAANVLVLSPGPELTRQDGSRRFIMQVSHRKSRNYETVEDFCLERLNGALLVPVDATQLDQSRVQRVAVVVNALSALGGIVNSKEVLVERVMVSANVSRGTAQNHISNALQDGMVLIVPINKKQCGYRLPNVEPPTR